MKKVEISSLIKERVKEELLRFIIEHQRDDFVKIPSERELAKNFDTSRTTIRSVIKELTKEGLLVQFQGKGTYITPKVINKELHVLCSPDIKRDDPFYTKFFLELANIAIKESINVKLVSQKTHPNKSITAPLVMIGYFKDDQINHIKKIYKLVISIEQYLSHNEIFQVSIDDYKIGWSAGELFIKNGYNYIIHLAGPDKYSAPYLRKLGFIDRLKREHNIRYEIIEGKMNWNSGYELGEEVIKRYIDYKKPIGIFTANDWMAIGLIQRLREYKIKIGEEISIIGCDNIPLSSEVNPPLATFDWDAKNIIKEIIHLVTHTNLNSIRTKRILIPAPFIWRASFKGEEKGV